VRTDAGRVSLTDTATSPDLDQANGGRVIVFSLAAAQRLFGRPTGVDVIYVDPAEGIAAADLKPRLAAAIGDHNAVVDATEPPPLVGVILLSFLPLFSLLGIFAIAIGAVLVYNTVTLSLEERRRQLAIVSAIGGTARVVAGGILVEACLLGLVGGLLGTVGGIVVAGPVTAAMSDFTELVAGIPLEVHVGVGSIVLGALLGVLVAVAASVVPARRALRVDIAAELAHRDLRDEAAAPSRWVRAGVWSAVAALGFLGCWLCQRNGAIEPWQAVVGPAGFLVLAVGTLFATASVAPGLVATLRRPSVRTGAPTRLAVANLVRDPRRTGIMAVAISAAVVTAFTVGSFNRSIRHAITESLTDNLDGVAVSTVEPNNTVNVEAKISQATIDAIAALPEVAAVHRGAGVFVGTKTTEIIGVEGYEQPWLELPLLLGTKDPDRLEAGEAIVGPAIARRLGTRPGDALRLATPTGFVEIPVQGIWQDGDYAGNSVQISYGLLELLYGPQPVQFLNADPVAGVSSDELARVIRAADLDPDLEVRTALELAAVISDEVSDQLAPFWVIQRSLLLVAFVAVLSTLLLVGVQRRREMGLLAAVGMRPPELARMVLSEAGLVAAAGIVTGAVVGVVMFTGLLWVMPLIIGFHDPFRPDLGTLLSASVAVLVLSIAAASWPAWRAARLEVLEALQYE
jgi:putative ABC transport system permease protein